MGKKEERYDVKDLILTKQVRNCRVSLRYTAPVAPGELKGLGHQRSLGEQGSSSNLAPPGMVGGWSASGTSDATVLAAGKQV